MRGIGFLIPMVVLWTACGRPQVSSATAQEVSFCADSAYAYTARQVQFGPRVMGSEAHRQCGDWLVEQLQQYGWTVREQAGYMTNYAGEKQLLRNIYATSPCIVHRASCTILLCSHWDSRPWADEEADYAHRFEPIPGANDGASGVGVLLEFARQWSLLLQDSVLAARLPRVDIVFFDGEDMGTPDHYTGPVRDNTWCLGSQLWALSYRDADPQTKPTYRCGILLDMVGDPSACFAKEYFSTQYAATYQERIWRTARKLGYGRYFQDQAVYPITDDHYYISTLASIPCVDIIDYHPGRSVGFQDWWHTQSDDMTHVHPQTLEAVGKTLLTLLKDW